MLARALLVVGTLLSTFVALEIGFRAWVAMATPEGEIWAVYDPDLGYRLNPRYGDTNEHGLRDHPVRPKDGRFRILVLGDSVAYYGDTLDDTFVGHLRGSLAADHDLAGIDVLNAGIKGYTNYQELQFLKHYGVGLEPDLVGVSFVLNDLHTFLHQFRVEDGEIVGTGYDFSGEAVEEMNPLYRLLRKSVFLVWLRHRMSILDDSVLLAATDGYSFEFRPDFRTAWLDEPWIAVEEQLREMKALGEDAGFGLFLVAFPFGDQYLARYLDADRSHVLKPQRKLREICERLSIPYLDLYPLLDPDLHLSEDKIHLTAEGRRHVGRLLADFLVANVPLQRAALEEAERPRGRG